MFLFVLYRNRNGTWYETKEKRKQFERWIEVIDEDVIKSQQNLGNVWFWSSLIDTEIEHDNFDRFVENGWMTWTECMKWIRDWRESMITGATGFVEFAYGTEILMHVRIVLKKLSSKTTAPTNDDNNNRKEIIAKPRNLFILIRMGFLLIWFFFCSLPL